MGWFILSHLFSTLISLVSIGRLSQQEKDLEILLLRRQLAISRFPETPQLNRDFQCLLSLQPSGDSHSSPEIDQMGFLHPTGQGLRRSTIHLR
jgi:hypothetical protein